jgi:exopolysaccharide biosynthesis polyprenyl glycosylphosphotransferase
MQTDTDHPAHDLGLTRAPRGRFGSRVAATRAAVGLRGPMYDVDPRGPLRSREAITRRMLAAADGCAAAIATATVVGWAGGQGLRPATLLLVVLLIAIHKVAGLYDRDDLVIRRSTLDEMPALLQLSSIYALCVAAVSGALFDIRPGPQQVVVLWLATALLITLFRMAARATVRAASPGERCLVVGDAEHVGHVRRKIDGAHGDASVVASLEVAEGRRQRMIGAEYLREAIERHDVHRVVIAPISHDASHTVDLVRIAKAAGVRVSILPRVLEAVGSAVEFDQIDGMTMLGVRRFGLNRSSRLVKRTFDLTLGGLAFVAMAPVLALVALAVRLDSPGPVLFRQTRIGRDGKPFKIFKFRSMVVDAEARKAGLHAHNEAGDGMFKITDDPRITRVGGWLRRTSLDELPQILNVLNGQMSLVGPRPLVADEDALVQGIYRSRLHLTPGMTGPWQVLGSTRVPLDEMIGIDYLYVANWSLWQDVKIILRTVPHVLARRGL